MFLLPPAASIFSHYLMILVEQFGPFSCLLNNKFFYLKEEPRDLGEPEQATSSVHPFSNRIIMPRRSLRTETEKETQLKAAEEKPNPLKMDKVIAYKGIRMNIQVKKKLSLNWSQRRKYWFLLSKFWSKKSIYWKRSTQGWTWIIAKWGSCSGNSKPHF